MSQYDIFAKQRFSSNPESVKFENSSEPKPGLTLPEVDREDANVELEKGETVLTKKGLFKVGGEKHSKGGTPSLLEGGDFVFSNSVFVNGSDIKPLFPWLKEDKEYSIADVSKSGPLKNLNKHTLNKESKDDILKSTAEDMSSNIYDKLSALAVIQEAKKGFPNGIPTTGESFLNSEPTPEAPMKMGGLIKAKGGLEYYSNLLNGNPSLKSSMNHFMTMPIDYSNIPDGDESNLLDYDTKKGFLKKPDTPKTATPPNTITPAPPQDLTTPTREYQTPDPNYSNQFNYDTGFNTPEMLGMAAAAVGPFMSKDIYPRRYENYGIPQAMGILQNTPNIDLTSQKNQIKQAAKSFYSNTNSDPAKLMAYAQTLEQLNQIEGQEYNMNQQLEQQTRGQLADLTIARGDDLMKNSMLYNTSLDALKQNRQEDRQQYTQQMFETWSSAYKNRQERNLVNQIAGQHFKMDANGNQAFVQGSDATTMPAKTTESQMNKIFMDLMTQATTYDEKVELLKAWKGRTNILDGK